MPGDLDATIKQLVEEALEANAVYFDPLKFKGKNTEAHDAGWLVDNPVGSINNPWTTIDSSPNPDPEVPVTGGTVLWETIGAEMEQYNANKGIRKKASSTASWSSPNLAACRSKVSGTITHSQSITIKIGDLYSGACALMLSKSADPDQKTMAGVDYGIYTGYGTTESAKAVQDGALAGPFVTLATGDLIRISYGSQITFEHSTNGGTSWETPFYISTIAPSGAYGIFVQVYTPGAGYSEITKA